MNSLTVKVDSLRLEVEPYVGLDNKPKPAGYTVLLGREGSGNNNIFAEALPVMNKVEIMSIFGLTEEEFNALKVYPKPNYED